MKTKTLIIFSREISTRIKTKLWIGVVSFFTVAAIAGCIFGNYMLNKPTQTPVYAYTSETAELAQTLKQVSPDIELLSVSDAQTGETAVQDGSAKVFIEKDADGGILTVIKSNLSATDVGYSTNVQLLQTIVQQQSLASKITDLGGDAPEVLSSISKETVTSKVLEKTAVSGDGAIVTYYFGLVISLLLFFMIFVSGSQIAIGIAEEKGSRIVEILLSTVKPAQLMRGKIIGIGIVTLLQYMIPVSAMLITANILGLTSYLPAIDIGTTVTICVVWALVGYITYSVLFAALAATANNVEDSKTAIMPVTLTGVIALYAAIYVPVFMPSGSLPMHLITDLPFVSVFGAPTAFAMGQVGLFEMLGSLAFSIALLPVLIYFSGRIYKGSILNSGMSIWQKFTARGARRKQTQKGLAVSN